MRMIISILLILFQGWNLQADTQVSGSIGSDTFWSIGGSPYVISGNLTVESGAMLTIAEGVELRAGAGVNIAIYGGLDIRGSSEMPVKLISNGSSSWGGLIIQNGNKCKIEYCQISSGGSGRKCPIRVNGTVPMLSNITLLNNGINAVAIEDLQLDKGTAILPATGCPWHINSYITIDKADELRVAAGAELAFTGLARIIIKGKLDCRGRPDSLITFTSENLLLGLAPKAGDWQGLLIDGGSAEIKYTAIEYAGGHSELNGASIYVESGSLIMEHSSISSSKVNGISAHGNAEIDLGKGPEGAKGANNFVGFVPGRYAIINASANDIYAKNNIWGGYEEENIPRIIYARHSEPKNYIYYQPIWNGSQKDTVAAPQLVSPDNGRSGLKPPVCFNWKSVEDADCYLFRIATNKHFTDIVSDTVVEKSFCLYKLDYGRDYYWQMAALRYSDSSDWSRARKFSTLDTARPETPKPIRPEPNSYDQAVRLTFEWQCSGWDKFQLQVSAGPEFDAPIIDEELTETAYYYQTLEYNTKYYWRIRAENSNGYSDWSETSDFITIQKPDQLYDAPPGWAFSKRTGENTTLVLRTDIDQSASPMQLDSGDAVGAFYYDGRTMQCAGYEYWNGTENISIAVWGDNNQTQEKDGFLPDELIRIKLWDSEFGEEFWARPVISMGSRKFTRDIITYIDKLVGPDTAVVRLEGEDWQLISSPVAPFIPNIDSITKGTTVSIKTQNSCYPIAEGVNKMAEWNSFNGYWARASRPDSIVFVGELLSGPGYTLASEANRLIICPYFNGDSISITEIFEKLPDIFLIADGQGYLSIADESICEITELLPGRAYRYFSLTGSEIPLAPETSHDGPPMARKRLNYIQSGKAEGTGNYSLTIFNSTKSPDGDCLSIRTKSGLIVGTGCFKGGRAVLDIWGDDIMAPGPDGAFEGEFLEIYNLGFVSGENFEWTEYSIKDYSGEELDLLRYSADRISIVDLGKNISVYDNEISEISGIEEVLNILENKLHTDVSLYNIYGRELIAPRGIDDLSAYPSGLYIIRVTYNGGQKSALWLKCND